MYLIRVGFLWQIGVTRLPGSGPLTLELVLEIVLCACISIWSIKQTKANTNILTELKRVLYKNIIS